MGALSIRGALAETLFALTLFACAPSPTPRSAGAIVAQPTLNRAASVQPSGLAASPSSDAVEPPSDSDAPDPLAWAPTLGPVHHPPVPVGEDALHPHGWLVFVGPPDELWGTWWLGASGRRMPYGMRFPNAIRVVGAVPRSYGALVLVESLPFVGQPGGLRAVLRVVEPSRRRATPPTIARMNPRLYATAAARGDLAAIAAIPEPESAPIGNCASTQTPPAFAQGGVDIVMEFQQTFRQVVRHVAQDRAGSDPDVLGALRSFPSICPDDEDPPIASTIEEGHQAIVRVSLPSPRLPTTPRPPRIIDAIPIPTSIAARVTALWGPDETIDAVAPLDDAGGLLAVVHSRAALLIEDGHARWMSIDRPMSGELRFADVDGDGRTEIIDAAHVERIGPPTPESGGTVPVLASAPAFARGHSVDAAVSEAIAAPVRGVDHATACRTFHAAATYAGLAASATRQASVGELSLDGILSPLRPLASLAGNAEYFAERRRNRLECGAHSSARGNCHRWTCADIECAPDGPVCRWAHETYWFTWINGRPSLSVLGINERPAR